MYISKDISKPGWEKRQPLPAYKQAMFKSTIQQKIQFPRFKRTNKLTVTMKSRSRIEKQQSQQNAEQQIMPNIKIQALWDKLGPIKFNDDQRPIEYKQKLIKKQAKIEMQIKAQRTMIKLGQKCLLPAMVQIKTSGGNRTNVDLICVLDVSGSMDGEKIILLKKTMKFLLRILTAQDRLCIITFNSNAQRKCALKSITQANIPQFNKLIDSLQANGDTSILKGMQTALKVMKDRVYKNDVTSVFLLSDGQDDKRIPNNLQNIINTKQYKGIDTFSIQSFGFGNDHDEDLMTNIAKVMDGNFYFIKQLDTLDQAFCSALGGIISVVAKELILSLQNVSKGRMKDVKISKVYGNVSKMINETTYEIKLLQIMSGVQKNFVFELQIPIIQGKVQDYQRNHDIIDCQFKAINTKDQIINGNATLKLTLLNSNEYIPEINENNDVLEHYLRLRAAEQIQDAIKKSENNQNETAQKNLDILIALIQQNKKIRRQKMQPLLNDLRETRSNCERQIFLTYGRKEMRNLQSIHLYQKSGVKSCNYQNFVQSDMLIQLRSSKLN